MENVPTGFMDSTVFLCVDQHDDAGVKHRVPKASGFFVRVPISKSNEPYEGIDYVVTARHCI